MIAPFKRPHRPLASWLAPLVVFALMPPKALAQVAVAQPYRDPYLDGPTRPLDGSPRAGYTHPPAASASALPTIWTGFYAGALFGTRWARTNADGAGLPNAMTARPQAGVHFGFDDQWGRLVLGVETDVLGGGGRTMNAAGSTSLSTQDGWTTTLRGRAGYAMGQALIYGTAGVVLAGQDVTLSSGAQSSHLTDTRIGAVFGAGVAYKFAPQVSARIETLHFSFKDQSVPWSSGTAAVKQDSTSVRAGLTVHFK